MSLREQADSPAAVMERWDRYYADLAKINVRAEAEKTVLARKALGLPPPKVRLARRERKLKPRVDGSPFTPAEAAAYLGVSPKTLLGHVKDGSLRYIDVSRSGSRRRSIKFDRTDLEDFKQNHRRQETPPCPSSAKARRITTSTSKSGVLDFAALRAARASAKRKP